MRAYLAVLKDSFREAFASRVLWILLALTTLAAIFVCTSRASSSATQPLPRASPYSAERLSPTTRIVGTAAARE